MSEAVNERLLQKLGEHHERVRRREWVAKIFQDFHVDDSAFILDEADLDMIQKGYEWTRTFEPQAVLRLLSPGSNIPFYLEEFLNLHLNDVLIVDQDLEERCPFRISHQYFVEYFWDAFQMGSCGLIVTDSDRDTLLWLESYMEGQLLLFTISVFTDANEMTLKPGRT